MKKPAGKSAAADASIEARLALVDYKGDHNMPDNLIKSEKDSRNAAIRRAPLALQELRAHGTWSGPQMSAIKDFCLSLQKSHGDEVGDLLGEYQKLIDTSARKIFALSLALAKDTSSPRALSDETLTESWGAKSGNMKQCQ